MANQKTLLISCQIYNGTYTVKRGVRRGKQRLICNTCGRQFQVKEQVISI